MTTTSTTHFSSPNQAALECPICGNTHANKSLRFEEKMFAMGEHFDYIDCAQCAAISIAHEPLDLSKYYPPASYYSVSVKAGFRARLKHVRNLAYTARYPGASLVRKYLPNTAVETTLLDTRGNLDCRVLDVGCGDGELVNALARLGLRRLTGVDPLASGHDEQNGVTLVRGTLSDVTGAYDLITFHHSLEHVRTPAAVLSQANKLLAQGGQVLVRIPTRDSLAYQTYGPNWFQIDAPRHMCLHSRQSITLVAFQAGLKVVSIECDSQPMQFWASEMYQAGLSLHASEQKKYRSRNRSLYRELAAFANKNGVGDQLVIRLARI